MSASQRRKGAGGLSSPIAATASPSTRVPQLADCEAIIERGLATFIEVGEALLLIRDARLYRERWATFEDYCRERWGLERKRAYDLTAAAEVEHVLSPTGDTPATERVARELAPLREEPEQLDNAWAEARERAASEQRSVTAQDVREAVEPRRRERTKEGFPRPGVEQTTVGQIRQAARRAERARTRTVRSGLGDWSCGEGLSTAATAYREAADLAAELASVLDRRAKEGA